MLWTGFMLFMFGWMLVLIFEFHLGAMPVMIVVATMMAFIQLIRRGSFQWQHSRRSTKPEHSIEIK